MQVYGHRSFPLDLRIFLPEFEARLAALSPRAGDITDLLIDFAEAEAAVADAYCSQQDEEVPALADWRAALHLLADAFCAAADIGASGGPTHSDGAARASRAVDLCRRLIPTLPVPPDPVVMARVAEGFSCYALYPEQYADAARQLAALLAGEPVVLIGIRSIGSVLAAVAAATLRDVGVPVETRTVRPRGHPFDRRLTLGPDLKRCLAARARQLFVVVDEGPGISGSSFASVVTALEQVGADRARIVLVPAWMPDVNALRSEAARDVFTTCRVVVGRSPLADIGREALATSTPGDYSAGLWRESVLPDRSGWPAVHPQHERVKFVDAADSPSRTARFAGLGRHGRSRLQRAEAMHDAGFGSRPVGLTGGLLVLEWIDGTPLSPRSTLTNSDVDRIANYLALVARRFATGAIDSGDDLASMLRQNAREGLNDAALVDSLDRLIDERPTEAAPRIAVDGRLLPQEWVAAARRRELMKVDAVDHHADDFLPGCRDIAWDLAGAMVEMPLAAAQREALLGRYIQATRDRRIVDRLPFFMAAYLAYRLGYTSMAAEALGGSADGRRFTEARERYRRLLAAHAERPRRAAAR